MILNKSNIGIVVISLFSIMLPCVSVAQQSQNEPTVKGIGVGPGTVYPGMEAGLTYDDNILRNIPGMEVDSFLYTVSPNLAYQLQDNTHKFRADWRLDAGYYDSSHRDNYLDNTISGELGYQPTSRFSAGLTGEYKSSRDPRGTGRAEGLAIGRYARDPDRWHHFKVEGNMAYGLQSGGSRLEAAGGYVSKRYDNNHVLTDYRDHDDIYGDGNFFFQVAPKTSLVVGGGITNHHYRVNSLLGASIDSTDYQFSGGITWKALSKTTGTIRFGYINKDFVSVHRANRSSFNWDAEVTWTPRSYSVVVLNTSRTFDETNGTGNFIQRDTYSVKWTHFWLDRLSSTVNLSYAEETFDPTSRQDGLINAGVQFNYDMRNWLTLSAAYLHDERDSNRNAFDYKRNVYLVTANVTF